MMSELEEALKPESPKNVSLMVSRNIGDVMTPAVRTRVISQFRQFDLNGNGKIDRTELTNVLTYLNPRAFNEERCEKLFDELDSDRSESIDYNEFIDWFFSCDKWSGAIFSPAAKAKARAEMERTY